MWTREEKAKFLTDMVYKRIAGWIKYSFSAEDLIKKEIGEEIRKGLEFIEQSEKGSGQSGL